MYEMAVRREYDSVVASGRKAGVLCVFSALNKSTSYKIIRLCGIFPAATSMIKCCLRSIYRNILSMHYIMLRNEINESSIRTSIVVSTN